ncbi:chaplin [Streptomyces sp. SID7909]|uniref:chaplin n=1 Tax=Streptomyces sp. SID7909 TaxID=2706092 RepID=UPI0013BC6813|nr:chaplin [Streptomyces sp. SID7909]NEC07750.1 chaplin [Streptomyces sp. SID7909]
MRQVTRKGLITMAAAGGVLALGGGYAHADAGASGGASNSPGVLSGNSVQVPVSVPVNVCGNSVDVVGLLNPSFGNSCRNGSGGSSAGKHDSASGTSGNHAGNRAVERGQGAKGGTGKHRASGDNGGGATAEGYTHGSPGLLSGNQIQAPIDIPVNACGNSIDVVGLLNPTFGNECENESTPPVDVPEPPPVHHVTPPTPEKPTPNTPEPQTVPAAPQLAHTGAGGLDLLIPASAGMLLAGAGTVLYRRAKAAA